MTTKTFDAVNLMRELRDRLSQEMEQMTPEERVLHIRDRVASTVLGRKLTKNAGQAAQQGAPVDAQKAARR